MNTRRRSTIVCFLFLFVTISLFAGPLDTVLNEVRNLYAQGNYAQAYALLAQSATTSSDSETKTQVAEAFAQIGIDEFNVKNVKNAYDCFKSALKLKPTHQQATTYFLKIKREYDVANLQNLGKRPTAATAGTPTGSTQTTPADGEVKSETASVGSTIQTEDLKKLMEQLKSAESKITAAETSVTSSKTESEFYRKQLEEQRVMLEKLIASNANQQSRTVNTQDAAIIQKSLNVLAELAAQNQKASAQPQVVVQSDPQLQNLIKTLEATRASEGPTVTEIVILVSLGILILVILFVVFLVLLAASRARKARKTREPFAADSLTLGSLPPLHTNAYHAEAPQTKLLEFVESGPTGSNTGGELAIRKALIKADRLQKMSEEIRSGTISWETVRAYIDELETSLKTDILNLVEAKLNAGDLVSYESALPILFPFLTDYDDFISDKAKKIARLALTSSSSGREDDDGVFSVKNLLTIPDRLSTVLKGKDRTLTTAKLSRSIAKELGLSNEECLQVYRGALAHDVGYLMLDSNELQRIVSKAEISEDEYEFIKSHVALGLTFFGESEIPEYIQNSILHHHERNDGSGYPSGIKKDEIPRIAKIIGVAETFASLVSNRAHRDKMEAGHAMAIIKDAARLKFDREIVDALVKVVQSGGGL